MKRIIEGRLYNTETAREIATRSAGAVSDFSHYEESLYKTRKGAWFLAGSGGPSSRWALSCGQNSWSSGEGISPLTEEEALEWCERAVHVGDMDADEVVRLFEVEQA